MTEAQAQAQLHILYEGDNSTPSATSSDYLTRRGLLDAGINLWESQPSILWRELYTTLADAADGTKTTTDGTSAYACPTDFRFPLGYLRIVDSNGDSTYYRRVKVGENMLKDNMSDTPYYYYVTGNVQDGHKVNIHPTPSSTGLTIKYEYYKSADTLSATDTKFEMSDPYFAIYFALSRLLFQDGQSDKAAEAMSITDAKLSDMKMKNEMMGEYQEDRVVDLGFSLGVGGFGA